MAAGEGAGGGASEIHSGKGQVGKPLGGAPLPKATPNPVLATAGHTGMDFWLSLGTLLPALLSALLR